MDAASRLAALERARQGDRAAWGELLESFRPYVRAITRGLSDGQIQGRISQSDLVQDALLEAHECLGQFRGSTVEELAGWLRQIVVRTVRHAARDERAAKRDVGRELPASGLENLAVDTGTSPSKQAIRHERAAFLAEAMERLPEEMRMVLLARHEENLDHATIAQRLARSEGAVRMLYLRALKRLREEYQKLTGESSLGSS